MSAQIESKAKDSISRAKEKEMLNERRAGHRAAAYLICIMLVVIWTLFQSKSAQAQWATNGNDTNNTNSGNVGVGTSTPDRKVDILDAASPQLRLTFTDSSVFTDLQTISSGQFIIAPSGMDVVAVTVTPTGVSPSSGSQSAGPITLRVVNQTGEAELSVQFYDGKGLLLREVTISQGQTEWSETFELEAGNYTLIADRKPEWKYSLTVQ
jgi:hypothetical protein